MINTESVDDSNFKACLDEIVLHGSNPLKKEFIEQILKDGRISTRENYKISLNELLNFSLSDDELLSHYKATNPFVCRSKIHSYEMRGFFEIQDHYPEIIIVEHSDKHIKESENFKKYIPKMKEHETYSNFTNNIPFVKEHGLVEEMINHENFNKFVANNDSYFQEAIKTLKYYIGKETLAHSLSNWSERKVFEIIDSYIFLELDEKAKFMINTLVNLKENIKDKEQDFHKFTREPFAQYIVNYTKKKYLNVNENR